MAGAVYCRGSAHKTALRHGDPSRLGSWRFHNWLLKCRFYYKLKYTPRASCKNYWSWKSRVPYCFYQYICIWFSTFYSAISTLRIEDEHQHEKNVHVNTYTVNERMNLPPFTHIKVLSKLITSIYTVNNSAYRTFYCSTIRYRLIMHL